MTESDPHIFRGKERWELDREARLDAARVYRLGLEKSPMAPRYHAVADERVPFREIAQVIGRRLKKPVVSRSQEEAAGHFGWFAHFAGVDLSRIQCADAGTLGWRPTQASLIPDIDPPSYFESNHQTFDHQGATK